MLFAGKADLITLLAFGDVSAKRKICKSVICTTETHFRYVKNTAGRLIQSRTKALKLFLSEKIDFYVDSKMIYLFNKTFDFRREKYCSNLREAAVPI